MTSLMNIAGPYHVTIEANQEKSIHLKKLLDVTNVPNHIYSGALQGACSIKDGDNERTL